MKYVQFVVGHFRGRIRYYALWNEQDIDYWNPAPNPEEYGRLLKAFIPAVHGADAEAKVVYGGQNEPIRDFARRALDACDCAAGIDVFAYHTYPGYGQNLNPESMRTAMSRRRSYARWCAVIPVSGGTSRFGTMSSTRYHRGWARTNPCNRSTCRGE